jgi:hypothetical protein
VDFLLGFLRDLDYLNLIFFFFFFKFWSKLGKLGANLFRKLANASKKAGTKRKYWVMSVKS